MQKMVTRRVDELLPYEHNPRINDEAAKELAKAIGRYGFRGALLIDGQNTIICGHTRWKALQLIGHESVDCIVADDMTEQQINEYRIMDNKLSELSTWDEEELARQLAGMDLSCFDIDWNLPPIGIDWAGVEDLTERTYEQPEHAMRECPHCHHRDRDIHFKKVTGTDDST